MRGMFVKEIEPRTGQKITLIVVLVVLACVILAYLTYIKNTARLLCDDVCISWERLERSLESKSEASALLSGYLVQSGAASQETFQNMLGSWEDTIMARSHSEKMNAGLRADNASYGIIALARSSGVSLNAYAERTLEKLDAMELQLASDIKSYNDTYSKMLSRADEVYLGKMLLAFSGCGDFGAFEVGREASD